MAPTRPWTVTPHGRLEKHEDNLWSVVSHLPTARDFPRRMTIARLADGRLVFHDSIPLEEAALAELRAWGRPALQLLTHRSHLLDAPAFRERLGLTSYCARSEREAIAARMPVDGDFEEAPLDDTVRARSIEGALTGEPMLEVRSGPRVSLACADVYFNLAHRGGVGGLVLRLAGFSGGVKVPWLWRRHNVGDAPAILACLKRYAALPGLARLLPCHGDVVEGDVGPRLLAAASRALA
jgi:hypothetical protein